MNAYVRFGLRPCCRPLHRAAPPLLVVRPRPHNNCAIQKAVQEKAWKYIDLPSVCVGRVGYPEKQSFRVCCFC